MTTATLSYFAPIGRVLLASPFLLSGPLKVIDPVATAGFMSSGGLPASPGLAIAVGAFEVAGGLALLLGWQARNAALLLSAFTLVASLLFHAFWAAPADQQFVVQLLFTKNIAIVGGLLFVTGVGAGAWSLDGQVRVPRTHETRAFDA